MNPNEFAVSLRQAAQQTRHAVQDAQEQGIAPFGAIPPAVSAVLSFKIKTDEKLRQLLDLHMTLPSSNGNLNASEIPKFLLDRIHRGTSPIEVAKSLYRLVESRTCTLVVVIRLDNFDIRRDVQITEKCRLVSPKSLPESEMRFHSFRNPENGDWPDRNAAALVYRDENFPGLCKGRLSDFHPPESALLIEIDKEFDKAIEIITLASRASPIKSWRYEYVDDPGWPALTPGGAGMGKPLENTALIDESVEENCARIRALGQWKEDKTICLALERLSSSRGKTNLTDAPSTSAPVWRFY